MSHPKEHEYRLEKIDAPVGFTPEPYRTAWRRDLGRIIHSASFRRLQGKTQLFPGTETDFFRNRLTHSLEVAQIAKSIAIKLNHDLRTQGVEPFIEPDIAEFAGLAHDLGHPPFGHFGEDVLDEKMKDSGGFEGNAQTLRILTKTEKRHLIENTTYGIDKRGEDKRVGLNLAVRSIASVLKYDNLIPDIEKDRRQNTSPIKGYYSTEATVVNIVKRKLIGNNNFENTFKTIECQIMDIADDIAYSTYDLEDSFKAGFMKPIDLLGAPDNILENVAAKILEATGKGLSKKEVQERLRDIFFDIFEPPLKKDIIGRKLTKELYRKLHFTALSTAVPISELYSSDGYYRKDLTSKLVGLAIRNVNIKKVDGNIPILSRIEMDSDYKIKVEILKHYTFESQILSQKVQFLAHRSKNIIGEIFDTLSKDKGYMLLPPDFKAIYLAMKEGKKRVICDFIASMTDKHAVEFYGRLTSENPHTIFKPLDL